jgi:hypothetical protein
MPHVVQRATSRYFRGCADEQIKMSVTHKALKSHRGRADKHVFEPDCLECSQHKHDFISVHAISITRQRSMRHVFKRVLIELVLIATEAKIRVIFLVPRLRFIRPGLDPSFNERRIRYGAEGGIRVQSEQKPSNLQGFRIICEFA